MVHRLPMMAQVSKLFTVLPVDTDRYLDVLGGGSFHLVSTYQGRYEANYGLVMRNNGKGRFTGLSSVTTSFILNGEIQDICPVKAARGLMYMVARNNKSIQLLKSAGNVANQVTTGGC